MKFIIKDVLFVSGRGVIVVVEKHDNAIIRAGDVAIIDGKEYIVSDTDQSIFSKSVGLVLRGARNKSEIKIGSTMCIRINK